MKLLIVKDNMVMGGIEASLLNFMQNMQKDFDIDLLVLYPNGELMTQIPSFVHLIESPFKTESFENVKKHKFILKLYSFVNKLRVVQNFNNKIKIKNFRNDEASFKNCEILNKKYDLAISFNGLKLINNLIVLEKCNATKKVCLIHDDIRNGGMSKYLYNQFSKFDKCFVCSSSCAEIFKSRVKNADVDYLYNFQDTKKILNGAKESVSLKENGLLNLCTVGRIAKVKGPFRLIKTIKKLNKDGLKFNFYWIGDGPEKSKVEKYIKKNNIENVYILGNQMNPFKYLKLMDLFILSSYYESAGMVLNEAMTLGVPVLSTKTCSAEEMVKDFGFVCENSDKGLYLKLKEILSNPEIINEKKKKIENYKWDNNEIRNKLIKFLEK